MTNAEDTARARSLEAELASEGVADDPTVTANRVAADLHREAAVWQRRAGNKRQAEMHEVYATVHRQLADRLDQAPGESGG